MREGGGEEELLRSVALQNAQSILLARQRAEEELLRTKEALERRSEQLAHSVSMLRATLESTTDGILVVDGEDAVTDLNEKFIQLWRIPAEVVAGRRHADVMGFIAGQFDEPERFLAAVKRIAANDPPESYDLLELPDGRVLERFSKVQIVDGRNAGRVWSFRDITDRRRAEEALRDETRVLELLNTTGAAIASRLDLEKLLQTVTDAATQLSGAQFGAFFYAARDEAGSAVTLYTLSGAARAAIDSPVRPAAAPFGPVIEGREPVRSGDVTRDPRFGPGRPQQGMPPGFPAVCSYLAVPVVTRSGESIGGLCFGHSEPDVFDARTERLVLGVAAQAGVAIDNARLYDDVKRAAEDRARLLESERTARAEIERVSLMKDEFLATLSHELRTPLNAVLGWSQVLLSRSPAESDLRRGLEAIVRNARSQSQLIEDLLDMSRIISGKIRLDLQRVDLTGIIDAAVESVRPSAEARHIRLVRKATPLASPLHADPNRLQQIIWNLLSNAVKFTPDGGNIGVSVGQVGGQVEIVVVDSGIGVSPEFLPHLFERFRQADSSTTRKFGGLGLGLSIVKQLVELHGGTVRAESAGKDRGTMLRVLLPLAVGRELGQRERQPAERKRAAKDALTGGRILVVDDEPDARDLLQSMLADLGAEVLVAGSVDQAILILQAQRPDLIVSDIAMPDKDGYELIRAVRELPPERGGRTPAIALTAFARSEDRTRAILSGYQMHLSKPVEPEELVASLASLLDLVRRAARSGA